MWSVVASPNPAALVPSTDPSYQYQLLSALGSIGITAANGWTINYQQAGGVYSLGTYYVWADDCAGVTQGNLPPRPAFSQPGAGGPVLGLHYEGQAHGAGNHWLQFVVTNSPDTPPGTPVFTDPNGIKYFIDGPQAQFRVPFMDTSLYAGAVFDAAGANGDIEDVVGQGYTNIFGDLYTFVGWFPRGNQKILNVALNGIHWGFYTHDPKGEKPRGPRKPLYPPPDFIPGKHGFDFLWGARPK